MIVREEINFERGGNPLDRLGVGDKFRRDITDLFKKWNNMYSDVYKSHYNIFEIDDLVQGKFYFTPKDSNVEKIFLLKPSPDSFFPYELYYQCPDNSNRQMRGVKDMKEAEHTMREWFLQIQKGRK